MNPATFERDQMLSRLRDAIDSRNTDAAHTAADHIELYLKAMTDWEGIEGWDEYRFTRRESRVVSCLLARGDKPASTATLMNAVYFDHLSDPPDDKIIQIYICKIRGKLALKNKHHVTTTHYGWLLKKGPAPKGILASGYRVGDKRSRVIAHDGTIARAAA